MSQERTRRPARKRQPEERPQAAQDPAAFVDKPTHESGVASDATHDPGGWLAIMLMAMATAIVAVVAILIWSAV
jgi:hypothetical protein